MAEVIIDSEKIAEIRNALQVIQGEAETLDLDLRGNALYKLEQIEKQVKRINGLLPAIKFEEGK